MTDIIALAKSKKEALEAEIAELEWFLGTAEELLIEARHAKAGPQATVATVAASRAPAPEASQDVRQVPSLPRAIASATPKMPSDALFRKILADQRARRADQEQQADSIHFEAPRTSAAGG